jgi:hypothetical protein
MNVLRFVLVTAAVLICIAPNRSEARLIAVLSYQEMFEKSDLVVIATAKNKTTDTKEQAFLQNIVQQDADGKQSKIKSIGVETVFAVSTVLKGDKKTRLFTLHHYREAQASGVVEGGPALVFFDPSVPSQQSSYLLFLVRETDGRFAPTGGQTDPGDKAINPLPLD